MIYRNQINLKPGLNDARGNRIKDQLPSDLFSKIQRIITSDVYYVSLEENERVARQILEELFIDPVIQIGYINETTLDKNFNWAIEVGYKPGVTDNVARSAEKGIEDILNRPLKPTEYVYTSIMYFIDGRLNQEEALSFAKDNLANELIERFEVMDKDFVLKGSYKGFPSPIITGEQKGTVELIELPDDDSALLSISHKRLLALTKEEMRTIFDYYQQPDIQSDRRKVGLDHRATDTELECLAQTWSEHCKHKIFNANIDYTDEQGKTQTIQSLFKTYISKTTDDVKKQAPYLISVFVDNAGVIEFVPGYNLCVKVETHNSPSALDPYGGAITGIVGVNRDIIGTGLGARPIFNTDIFCFASPNYQGNLRENMLHPRRIFIGVHRGVKDGGNESGIPTVNGSIVFEDRYIGKPLVFCGTGGIMPSQIKGIPSHQKVYKKGDLAVMCGGRIGKDGIHGATFSSLELSEESPTSAVQIGDPITQKKMLDFLIEARDAGLYTGITDNGAGGLSSSIGEMARQTNGCEIYLDKAPLKYAGLDPWEILISEAQERMTIAIDASMLDSFMEMAKIHDVECTVVGKFTDSGYFHALYENKTVAYLKMDFLHEGLPPMQLKAVWKTPNQKYTPFPTIEDHNKLLLEMLSRLNIASKEEWVRQYDHEVQALTCIKPFTGKENDGPQDAAVIRPLPENPAGIAIGHGIIPRYSDIDTYHMAQCTVDEAIRNIVAVGADPETLSGLDNFCWPDPIQSDITPDGEYKLAQLVRCCAGLYDYCVHMGIPLISGKDSMKNDYGRGKDKISIPPTLLFTALGKVHQIEKSITMDAKSPGDLIFVIGNTYKDFGASEYELHLKHKGNTVPKVRLDNLKSMYKALHQAIQNRYLQSCHDLSDGGLGVAAAEIAIAGRLGIEIELKKVPTGEELLRNDEILYSESPSRFIVTVSPKNKEDFISLMTNYPCKQVGKVIAEPILKFFGLSGNPIIQCPLETAVNTWKDGVKL